jgi:hypothetical protein
VRDSSISRSSFVRVILYRGTILYNRTELDYRIRHPQRYCLLAPKSSQSQTVRAFRQNPELARLRGLERTKGSNHLILSSRF